MTTPTMPAGITHTAAPLAPQPYGLYSVTSVIELDEPARTLGGADWVPTNCGGAGVWDHGTCPEPAPSDVKGGIDRPDHGHFPTVVLWASDECPITTVDTADAIARAQHLLALNEPLLTEEHLAGLLAERATPLPAVASLTDAVGALEEALGGGGFTGVLHSRRGLAAHATNQHLILTQGARMVTAGMSTPWAFGGGYTVLGDTVYATGPLTLWRSPVTTRVAITGTTNERLALAERRLIVGWECPDTVYSVSIGGGS
ncbi:hypothetical protein [Nocardia farcinica]|uniref:hypothetical protein n=1 Tax=Nocardia farcinica TaxID=37329 RepID=UPI00342EB04E